MDASKKTYVVFKTDMSTYLILEILYRKMKDRKNRG